MMVARAATARTPAATRPARSGVRPGESSRHTNAATSAASPTTTAPPRVGATRATALPRASQFLQGSFYLVINSTSPTAIPELVGATPTGFSYVGIHVTLVCSGATETPCNNAIPQRFEQTFVMTDAAGNVTNPVNHLYGLAFTIFGFVELSRATCASSSTAPTSTPVWS